MMRLAWAVAIVCAAVLSACGGSDNANEEQATGESSLGSLTEALEEAGEVEAIVDEQKRRTDAALEEAEERGPSPRR